MAHVPLHQQRQQLAPDHLLTPETQMLRCLHMVQCNCFADSQLYMYKSVESRGLIPAELALARAHAAWTTCWFDASARVPVNGDLVTTATEDGDRPMHMTHVYRHWNTTNMLLGVRGSAHLLGFRV